MKAETSFINKEREDINAISSLNYQGSHKTKNVQPQLIMYDELLFS